MVKISLEQNGAAARGNAEKAIVPAAWERLHRKALVKPGLPDQRRDILPQTISFIWFHEQTLVNGTSAEAFPEESKSRRATLSGKLDSLKTSGRSSTNISQPIWRIRSSFSCSVSSKKTLLRVRP